MDESGKLVREASERIKSKTQATPQNHLLWVETSARI